MSISGIHPTLLVLLTLLGWIAGAAAHPAPDLPVRGVFKTGGECTIYVEINPRGFDARPNDAPALTAAIYKALPQERKAELIRQAGNFTKENLEFYFEPWGRVEPDFAFDF